MALGCARVQDALDGYRGLQTGPCDNSGHVGAKLVPNYLKNVTTPDQYELLEMARIGGFVKRQKGLGRPTKKDGREMKEFTEEAFFGFDDWDDENPLWTEDDEIKLGSRHHTEG